MKRFGRWLVRRLLYARLGLLSLNEEQARYWAETMKRWPGIFDVEPFRRVRELPGGLHMELGLIDVVERTLSVTGKWDEPILRAMTQYVLPASTFVDIGANIGYFTLQASRLAGPSGLVLALEPSYVNLPKLCDNVRRNAAGNVLICSAAAGRDHAMPSIQFPTFNNAGAASLRPMSSVSSNRVLQLPLDDLIEQYGLQPDVVKLDIEGFELEALRGMTRTLQRFGPVVICELTDSFLREIGQSARELLEFMEQLGYEATLLTSGSAFKAGAKLRSTDAAIPLEQVDVVFVRAAATTPGTPQAQSA